METGSGIFSVFQCSDSLNSYSGRWKNSLCETEAFHQEKPWTCGCYPWSLRQSAFLLLIKRSLLCLKRKRNASHVKDKERLYLLVHISRVFYCFFYYFSGFLLHHDYIFFFSYFYTLWKFSEKKNSLKILLCKRLTGRAFLMKWYR